MCRQKYFVRYYFDINEGKKVDAEFEIEIMQGETVLKEDNVKLALEGDVRREYNLTKLVNPNEKFECFITLTKWVATDK